MVEVLTRIAQRIQQLINFTDRALKLWNIGKLSGHQFLVNQTV